MASTFPGSIDNFTDPLANSSLASPSHAGQHSDLNDAVNKIETYMGLTYVTHFSFSGQTAVNIDNVFSSRFEQYELYVCNWRGSSAGYLYVQTRSGGVTDTGTNYSYAENLGGINVNQTAWRICYAYNTTNRANGHVTIFQPYQSGAQTVINGFASGRNSTSGFLTLLSVNQKQTATADDGLRFTHSGGATMDGEIRIFGVNKP